MPHRRGGPFGPFPEDLRKRTEEAIEKADLAFWAEIAKSFPEATGGDFPPDVNFAWNQARDGAVYWWLVYNHPEVARIAETRDDEADEE